MNFGTAETFKDSNQSIFVSKVKLQKHLSKIWQISPSVALKFSKAL